ncbi:MAG: HD domain-containing protein [Ruminococcus sp.]|nr:HD domain-containing protein [Ruminococcus sp.]
MKAVCSRRELTGSSYYICVRDIITDPRLEPLKDITHHISTTRFQHCLNVSYYSFIICRRLRLDARSAARAGLLHDLFYYDRREYSSSRKKGQPGHSAMHSMIALRNAGSITELNVREKDMILKHMWPLTRPLPRYMESYVITIVDKYCAVLEFCAPKVMSIVNRLK